MHTANITVFSSGTARSAATTATVAAASVDTLLVPFGVRSISFTAAHGFQLNGVETKLYGGCVHHDNGPLGAMAITRAEERRVANLKALGVRGSDID